MGTDPEAELSVGPAVGVLPHHAEFRFEGREVHLHALGTVHLNGQPVAEVRLRDGDRIDLGDDVSLRLRLRAGDEESTHGYHGLLSRVQAAGAVPRAAGRLLHRGGGALVTLLLLAIVLGGVHFASRTEPPRDPVEASLSQERLRQQAMLNARERSYQRKLQELRGEIEQLEQSVAHKDDIEERVGAVRRAVAEVETNVLDRLSSEMERSLGRSEELKETLDAVRMERADAAAQHIIATYGRSVCLIQGAYGFGKERDGKWQFLREATPELLQGMELNGDKVPLMLAGKGPVFQIEYTGTAFVVDRSGIVITNRHIAEPWWKNGAAEPLIGDGYEPRFIYLRAYFPGRKRPVKIDVDKTVLSLDADLAAMFFKPKGKVPEPLELADPKRTAPGQRVLLLGYPSGLDALLARTKENFAQEISGGGALDPLAVLDALAERGLVRALPTQGHIADVLKDRIVFDAPTAVGGSGGPLVDMKGRVVAINYGILKAFRGANFGVPVSYAAKLLKRARVAR